MADRTLLHRPWRLVIHPGSMGEEKAPLHTGDAPAHVGARENAARKVQWLWAGHAGAPPAVLPVGGQGPRWLLSRAGVQPWAHLGTPAGFRRNASSWADTRLWPVVPSEVLSRRQRHTGGLEGHGSRAVWPRGGASPGLRYRGLDSSGKPDTCDPPRHTCGDSAHPGGCEKQPRRALPTANTAAPSRQSRVQAGTQEHSSAGCSGSARLSVRGWAGWVYEPGREALQHGHSPRSTRVSLPKAACAPFLLPAVSAMLSRHLFSP